MSKTRSLKDRILTATLIIFIFILTSNLKNGSPRKIIRTILLLSFYMNFFDFSNPEKQEKPEKIWWERQMFSAITLGFFILIAFAGFVSTEQISVFTSSLIIFSFFLVFRYREASKKTKEYDRIRSNELKDEMTVDERIDYNDKRIKKTKRRIEFNLYSAMFFSGLLVYVVLSIRKIYPFKFFVALLFFFSIRRYKKNEELLHNYKYDKELTLYQGLFYKQAFTYESGGYLNSKQDIYVRLTDDYFYYDDFKIAWDDIYNFTVNSHTNITEVVKTRLPASSIFTLGKYSLAYPEHTTEVKDHSKHFIRIDYEDQGLYQLVLSGSDVVELEYQLRLKKNELKD